MTAPAVATPAVRRSASRTRVTGRYAGPISRLAAIAIDWVIALTSFTLTVSVTSYLLDLLTPWTLEPGDAEGPWWFLGLVAWMGAYLILSTGAVARTPGKGIVGLRIVRRDGHPLGARRAVLRVLAFPLTLCTLGIGFIGLLVGREARALHDVIAGTAVVYDWGDRPAELPSPITRWMAREGVATGAPGVVADGPAPPSAGVEVGP